MATGKKTAIIKRRAKCWRLDPSDERRIWVQEAGDSPAGFDLVHEQTVLGGGYYAKGRYNPDAAVDLGDEGSEISAIEDRIDAEAREIRELNDMFAIVASMQTTGDPLPLTRPWSRERKIAFVRRNGFVPVYRDKYGNAVIR